MLAVKMENKAELPEENKAISELERAKIELANAEEDSRKYKEMVKEKQNRLREIRAELELIDNIRTPDAIGKRHALQKEVEQLTEEITINKEQQKAAEEVLLDKRYVLMRIESQIDSLREEISDMENYDLRQAEDLVQSYKNLYKEAKGTNNEMYYRLCIEDAQEKLEQLKREIQELKNELKRWGN